VGKEVISTLRITPLNDRYEYLQSLTAMSTRRITSKSTGNYTK